MAKQKKQVIFGILVIALLINLIPQLSYGAGSTITVSSSAYLYLSEIPNSTIINSTPLTVPTDDQVITSDEDGPLPSSRSLTVTDNRNSGGYLLQLDASTFLPAVTPSLNDGFRMVTSGESDLYGGETPVGGVVYLAAAGESAFIGPQTVTAPLNASSTNFTQATTYTGVSGNILNTTVDVLDGCLTSGGRKGLMNVHVSYYIEVPKYTPAPSTGDQYYSTLTYTLTDYTPGSCP